MGWESRGMRVKLHFLLVVAVLITAAGCGTRTAEHTLSGRYYLDKNKFFPNGRDAEAEVLWMAALKEGSSNLIINIDARSPGGQP